MSANTRTNILPFKEAHEWFFYEKETGKLYWKMKPSDKINLGSEAGHVSKRGYTFVKLNGKQYASHNIIWVMSGRNLPIDKTVDHIDKCRSNNRLDNLRLATGRQQSLNRNVKGFTWDKRENKWLSLHKSMGRYKTIGRFSTALQARLAYERYTTELEPEFASTEFTDALKQICGGGHQINWQPSSSK